LEADLGLRSGCGFRFELKSSRVGVRVRVLKELELVKVRVFINNSDTRYSDNGGNG